MCITKVTTSDFFVTVLLAKGTQLTDILLNTYPNLQSKL